MSQSETGSRGFINIDWQAVGYAIAGVISTIIVFTVIFLVACLNEVEQHEVGYMWSRRTGEITVLPRSGYFLTPPFIEKVKGIDTRPQQVCINANSRVLNCKLVQFDPAGLKLFLTWHGLQGGTVSEILKSYAYDGQNKSYPFLIIKTELGAQSSGDLK